jgi:hypothetical protein
MATVDQQWVQVPMTAEAQAIVGMPMKQPAAHSGTYGGTSTLWKSCNREGLPDPAEESCVAEILAHDHKTTGKTGDDHQ